MSTTSTQSVLIRTDLWSTMIQEELQEELMGQQMVEFVTDFPDGDTLHIPTFSSLSARTYIENTDVIFDDPTSGEFTLTIDHYLQSGTYITDKFKEDSFYVSQVQSKFPQMMVRALMERLENDIFLLHKEQTTNTANTINGQPHRYLSTGAGGIMSLDDFWQAKLSLDKANVSKIGRMAIVDPTVTKDLGAIDNVFRQDVYGANSVIREGFGATSYLGKYAGFDVYESNMLDEATALDHAAGGALIANVFVGAEAFKGAVRTMPSIEPYRNVGKKRDEYSALMRYGLGLYRDESLVTVLSAVA